MNPGSEDWARLIETVEALRNEVSRMGDRLKAIESATVARATPPPATAPPRKTEPAAETLDEELILAIGAAIAAFLGERAHIRQISLIGSAAWAQQGRATIQDSHAAAARHGTRTTNP